MSDVPSGGIAGFARSPFFRVIFSNFFRTRITAGDCTVVFGLLADTPGSPNANLIQEEVSVAMTWPQMKMLSIFLNDLVVAVESETGTIPTAAMTDKEAVKESVIQTLRNIDFKARP